MWEHAYNKAVPKTKPANRSIKLIMKRSSKFFATVVALAAIASISSQLSIACAQSSAFSYQGKITASGTNFSGNGWFKFAVLQLGTNQARQAAATADYSSGYIKTIAVTDGGAGYLTPPAVTIYGVPGPQWGGASATAVVSHGAVVAIDVVTVGSNFLLGATVSIAAPPPDFTVITDWSNNGSSVDGSEPSLPVPIPVANGLFMVNLGASPPTVYLDPLIFTNSDLLLRIWFSGDGTNFQQLTPDQPFTATPYALMSANAANAFNAVNALNVLGTIPAGGLTGTYGSTVNFSNAANYFSGNGSNLTGLNASQLNSGTVPDARLAGNVARLNGSAIFTGGVFATNFIGSGDGLTSLNGLIINAGTIPNSALVASTVTASKIASGQVVKSLNGLTDAVTLSAGNNVLLTTVGNTLTVAATATGVPWQKIIVTNFQAQANTGYVVTNSGYVNITLPAAPNFGDIVRLSNIGAGPWRVFQNTNQTVITANLPGRTNGEIPYLHTTNRDWTAVACSTNGNKLVATVNNGPIYVSTDAGTTWTARDGARAWVAVASSADGSKLVAVVGGGLIYTSGNSGTNWTPRASNQAWTSVASSANGNNLCATASGGFIYMSTDSGVTWTARASAAPWTAIASSADGSKLVAAEMGVYNGALNTYMGHLHTSTDSGVTWTIRAGNGYWNLLASSADGTKLFAVAGVPGYAGQLYTSADSGVTWNATSFSQTSWGCIATSANGIKLVAARSSIYQNNLETSTDSGQSWQPQESPNYCFGVASSADGTKLIAVRPQGVPYGSIDSGVTWTPQADALPYLDGAVVGSQNSALELQYIGNHQFLPLSIIGNVSSY